MRASVVRIGRVYAAGAVNTDQPQYLVLLVSDDQGESWREVRDPGRTRTGVESLWFRAEGEAEELYLGTRDGVFRVVQRAR